MRLKTLETVGFKSFVDRTVVNFENNVTAIVGPNGCGKSNIVDAIRWVMGEQSAKHLRGNAMEDVIFAGSAAREAVGMAQVFLTFDNSDGRAPADYANVSEIEVGRRLYRSGESEYFINKTPCRLKDIVDLFLDTGVGTKAYSIIEQGMVGKVVSSRPIDRRLLIEEAAGISKFKSRKEAALRKIDSTKSNLLRLADLMTELQRQINSLNRQAKKAERYQYIATELKEREQALALLRYDDLVKSASNLELERTTITEKETLISSELSKFENEIEELKLSSAEVERDLEKVQEDYYGTSQSIKLCESEITHKTKGAEDLLSRSESLEEELVSLKERLKLISERLHVSNQEKVEADCSVETLVQSVEKLEQETNSQSELKHNLEDEIDEMRDQLMKDATAYSELKVNIENLGRRTVEITGRIAKNQSEVDALNRRKEELTGETGECQKKIEDVHGLRERINNDIATKKNKLDEISTLLLIAEKHNQSLQAREHATRSKLESLEELRRNLDGYREGVKSVLLRSKQVKEEFKGILGTVADIIETDPTYETAASAVLGDRLQYVVVESHNQGVEAVEYLKTASTGRSSFIPLSVRNTFIENNVPQGEGIIGPLTDYVRFSDDYKHIARFLFSDVVVVNSLKEAIQTWESLESNNTYVTLGGEVLSPPGVITGGKGGDEDAGFIAQKRRIKELQYEISVLEVELEKSTEELKTLSETKTNVEGELEELEKNLHNLEINLLGRQHDLNGRQEESSRLDSEHDGLVVEIAELLDNKNKCEKEYSESSERLVIIDQRRSNLELSIEDKNKELDGISDELIDREKQLVELKVSMAQAESRQTTLTREIEQGLDQKTETSVDIARKEDEITTGRQKIVVLRREVDERKDLLKSQILKLEELTKAQQELQNKYSNATTEIRNKELSTRELRMQRDEAIKLIHDSDLKLTEAREKIRYLVESMCERYRMDLPSLERSNLNRDIDIEAEELAIEDLKSRIDKIGAVNVDAIKEYEELSLRYEFIDKQHSDLTASLESLKQAISKINKISKQRFIQTFDNVNEKFREVFPRFFEGGKAKLILAEEVDLLESGVEIAVQPPGKRLQSITLLSGGEKALTAIAFIFSIFLTKPSPFCLLDEVDAPLDDANVDRFNNMIRAMTDYSQFVLISHNKRTMELADVLYGVTMQEPGTSKIVSVRLNKENITDSDVQLESVVA